MVATPLLPQEGVLPMYDNSTHASCFLLTKSEQFPIKEVLSMEVIGKTYYISRLSSVSQIFVKAPGQAEARYLRSLALTRPRRSEPGPSMARPQAPHHSPAGSPSAPPSKRQHPADGAGPPRLGGACSSVRGGRKSSQARRSRPAEVRDRLACGSQSRKGCSRLLGRQSYQK